ncbi:hypothetical protein INR49_000677 [Caranx melampygus]|nr:hypothetical protein INR49_000677 [Caranx melampygus]
MSQIDHNSSICSVTRGGGLLHLFSPCEAALRSARLRPRSAPLGATAAAGARGSVSLCLSLSLRCGRMQMRRRGLLPLARRTSVWEGRGATLSL